MPVIPRILSPITFRATAKLNSLTALRTSKKMNPSIFNIIKNYSQRINCRIRKVSELQELSASDTNENDKNESAEAHIGEDSTLETDYEDF